MKIIVPILFFACRESETDQSVKEETLVVDQDGDGYTGVEDCDDMNAQVHAGALELCDGLDNDCNGEIDDGVRLTFYVDSDGDGYGNPDITTEACEQPEGFVPNSSDCDDASSISYPSASEVCDGLDNDCNGEIDEGLGIAFYVDFDGDGFGNEEQVITACAVEEGLSTIAGDCDDLDPAISPVANELCDNQDNNCDGEIDEGVTSTFYADVDGDGFGDPQSTTETCMLPFGYIDNDADCNDLDSQISPAAEELCDNQDNDCDGEIDEEGAIGGSIWYADADQDGYGAASTTRISCVQPVGYVADNSDCDDSNSIFSPAAIEVCNGFDDNCDGQVDEQGASDAPLWYVDSDNDGFGSSIVSVAACSQPAGYVVDSSDCDDNDNDIYPGAPEACNGEDDNCDGIVDEASAMDASTWYADMDGDGYGDPNTSMTQCQSPEQYVLDNSDCDDSDVTVNPTALWYVDADGDGHGSANYPFTSCEAPAGYVSTSDDCNDLRNDVYPNATEVCDSVDNNCDGQIDEVSLVSWSTWYADVDGDGYGDSSTSQDACAKPADYVAENTDCNDNDSDIYPGAFERCNSVDDNCDGLTDDESAVDSEVWYADVDSDGYGDADDSLQSCEQPVGYVDDSSDCDDSSELIQDICALGSCQDWLAADSSSTTGSYMLQIDDSIMEVHCNMDLYSGGWTLAATLSNTDGVRSWADASSTNFSAWLDNTSLVATTPTLDQDYKSEAFGLLQASELMIVTDKGVSAYWNGLSQSLMQHIQAREASCQAVNNVDFTYVQGSHSSIVGRNIVINAEDNNYLGHCPLVSIDDASDSAVLSFSGTINYGVTNGQGLQGIGHSWETNIKNTYGSAVECFSNDCYEDFVSAYGWEQASADSTFICTVFNDCQPALEPDVIYLYVR